MRKLTMLILGMLVLSSAIFAQTRTITGKLVDEAGSPVPNASVIAKGTNVGTTTKVDGTFSLNVPNNVTAIIISSIGFQETQVSLGTGSFYDVAIKAGIADGSEVVVTGYGRVKRSNFAGAATVLGPKVTENMPLGSFNQTLQGRAPGVLVNSGSGQPGANAQVTIRGISSIQGAGAQPLYIIDGVPTSANDFQALNPNDFESMTILKDANAAALYGARGGVGVIVITTRQGRNGATQITARTQVGVTQAPNFDRLNLMNTAEIIKYEEQVGLITNSSTAAFNVPGWAWSRLNPANANLPEATLQAFDRALDSTYSINTNLRDLLFRTGLSQTYEVNLRGGTEKTQYFMSVSYFNQQGIDLVAALKRYTARFNLTHVNNNLRVQWNNQIGYSQTTFAEGDNQGNSTLNPFQMIYRAKTYNTPYRADGTLNFGGGGTNLALKNLANLLEGYQQTSTQTKTIKINSGLTIQYNILKGLVAKNVFGIDLGTNLNERYINPGSYIGSTQTFLNGLAAESYILSNQLINTSSLNYSLDLGAKHELGFGAYFEAVRVYNKGLGFVNRNLTPGVLNSGQGANPLPTNGAVSTPQNASSARSGYGIRSYFGTVAYTFDDRISLNGNVRRDGTSRIAATENKEITTYSFGAIWNVTKEKFMAEQNIFTDVRLRGSYGLVPNIGSITSGTYGVQYGSVPNYAGIQIPYYAGSSYSGSIIPGINPQVPGNPDYAIEKIQKTNIGLDFSVWKSKARFTVDVYRNMTIDMFVNQPIFATGGFGNQDINAGKMSNKGVEFTADVDIFKSKDLSINVGMNHAINTNKIEDLGLVEEYFAGTFVIRKGLPYGSHYTYNYLGADVQTGAPIFETADGQTTNQRAQAGQFAKFGTYLPKHVGGFNLSVAYKGFSFEAFFSYQFDVVRSNNTRNWITRGTTGYASAVNQSRELLTDQWQKPGDVKFFNSSAYDRDFTSADLEDAKFLRFRNLNVAYQIPAFNFKSGKSIIKGATVYANFNNLHIWSPWRGVDPEDNNNISLVEYPNPRMVVFGLDIKL
ncbi:MAG: SusC/RagA family TonB-linked outer membrane protein [Chitinophagaceae bacterium]|nr:MAG: SusC/RagA family TonB-linked outer membrane protein [Chitinophagaceae bacterium]